MKRFAAALLLPLAVSCSSLQYDDPDKVPCRTIDLPAKVFAAVMPRKQDLPYLAHVGIGRIVNRQRRELGLDPMTDSVRELLSPRPILATDDVLTPGPSDSPIEYEQLRCFHPFKRRPLPAKLEADGNLRLQVRPGRWTVYLMARAPGCRPAAAAARCAP